MEVDDRSNLYVGRGTISACGNHDDTAWKDFGLVTDPAWRHLSRDSQSPDFAQQKHFSVFIMKLS